MKESKGKIPSTTEYGQTEYLYIYFFGLCSYFIELFALLSFGQSHDTITCSHHVCSFNDSFELVQKIGICQWNGMRESGRQRMKRNSLIY